jgi:hypothetical protein
VLVRVPVGEGVGVPEKARDAPAERVGDAEKDASGPVQLKARTLWPLKSDMKTAAVRGDAATPRGDCKVATSAEPSAPPAAPLPATVTVPPLPSRLTRRSLLELASATKSAGARERGATPTDTP